MEQVDILVRKAEKTDLPRIFELYRELQPDDPPIDENRATTVWEHAIKNGVIYFVAESNGIIVASCYVAIIPNITRRCSSIGFVENIITTVDYRRQGIARKLLETAVEYAKNLGCYKVTLQSGGNRMEAHKFYESVGFDGNSKRAFEIRF
jgi:GNAT superfamily N-acetyltransferase